MCKSTHSITIARSPAKGRLNTVTDPSTAIILEEDLLDATEAEDLSPLPPEAMAVRGAFLQAMQAVCCANS